MEGLLVNNLSKFAPILLAALVLSSLGCHRKLKDFAAQANEVTVQVAVSGRPTADLHESGPSSENLAGAIGDAVVATASIAESVKTQKRLERVMNPAAIRQLAVDGAFDELSGGVPFAGSVAPQTDGLVQLQLNEYGIVQYNGGPTFYAQYNIQIFRAGDNKRVYRKNISCYDSEFYVPSTAFNLAGTLATIQYVSSMSDEELIAKIEASIDRCTTRVFSTMRRHAG